MCVETKEGNASPHLLEIKDINIRVTMELLIV